MGLGSKGPRLVAGQAVTETSVVDDTRNKAAAPRVKRVEQVVGPVEVHGDNYALVTAGHDVGMSIDFQSVQTRCTITIPVPHDPRQFPDPNNAPHLKAAAEAAWSFVEDQHQQRSQWAADVMRTLRESRRKAEGR